MCTGNVLKSGQKSDLAGFAKNGQMPDLWELGPKSGAPQMLA